MNRDPAPQPTSTDSEAGPSGSSGGGPSAGRDAAGGWIEDAAKSDVDVASGSSGSNDGSSGGGSHLRPLRGLLRPIERQLPFGRCGLGLRFGRQHVCRLHGDRPAMPQPDLLPLVWTPKNTRRAAAFVRSSVQEGRTGRRTIIWPSRASHYGSEGGSVPPPFWWRGWTHARSPVRTLRQVPTI